jgi:hypothetical protein
MPSGPTLFDAEDGAEPDRAPAHPERAESDDRHTPDPGPRRRSPNYLFRRAVVVGGVVAVLATASVAIGQLIGSGDEETASGAVGTDWNRVVLVDDRTGRVVVDDAAGDEVARLDSGVRNPTASEVVDSTLVVAGADAVAVIDLDDMGVAESDLGAETIVTPAGSALTMVAARPDGGRALLVHGPSGELIDTDTFAPVVGARYEFADSRSARSGRHVLVTDSGNFQSVLFSFDRDAPSFFPGLALAVDDDLVVTAQNVGADATVNVFDHDGEPISTGRTASVRAGMIAGSGVVLVTADGAVVTMSADGEMSGDAQLEIGTIQSGVVTTSGDRLVVTGASGAALVDETGAVLASFDAQRPAAGGSSPAGSNCLTTIDLAADNESSQLAVIDTTDGSVVVEASGTEPVHADASGCVVGATTPNGFDVMSSDGVQQSAADDLLLAVSLDGAVVAVERSGRVLLVEVGSDGDRSEDDPIDLGPSGRTVHFTQS